MQNPSNLAPSGIAIGAEDAILIALAMIGDAGLDAVESALGALADGGLTAADSEAQAVLVEILVQLLEALEQDPGSARAYEIIFKLDPAVATAAMTLLFISNFPDGEGTVADLSDGTALCLSALTAAAGQARDALDFLAKAEIGREAPRFLTASLALRARMLGVVPGLKGLWRTLLAGPTSVEDARDAIDARPLDIVAHRALIRHLAQNGDVPNAVSALFTALALPVEDAEKRGLAEELGILAAYADATGQPPLFDTHNAGFALGACPAIVSAARTMLSNLKLTGGWQALGQPSIDAAMRILAYFEENDFPAFPLHNGKPRVDIVWLEITNFCNQKCTFCPDMHREDKRTWLPLEDIKRTIDQLAETVSVGSMQLNAYGEPLLHPNIDEILAYIRVKKLPFPTYFTTHGMTLVEKKLAQLSHNYPQGIAVSLHNDSQDSYERTRSAKIGDYETLVTRVSNLMAQMVDEGAASHLRLYQMVCNDREDKRVPPEVRAGFADSAERVMRHARKWEEIAARIAAAAPPARRAKALTNSFDHIEACFNNASHDDGNHIPLLTWRDEAGREQVAFMSPRPVGTYANLLLEYHPTWQIERKLLTRNKCGFTRSPSLAIFATGKLGICCLDLNSTATFGALSDYGSLREALESIEAKRMFAQLSNGVAVSKGCQICLASGKQLCGPKT